MLCKRKALHAEGGEAHVLVTAVQGRHRDSVAFMADHQGKRTRWQHQTFQWLGSGGSFQCPNLEIRMSQGKDVL